MSQERFHNYHRPLIALAENSRILGAITPGVYCGFDSIELKTGTTLAFRHDTTGIRKTGLNGIQSTFQSLVVSRSGVFIYEDAPIELNVAFNATGFVRVDLLVMTHSFIDAEGGSNASYTIIQGIPAAGVPIEPTVSDPKIQVPIGYIYVQAAAASHALTAYKRITPSMLGGKKPLSYDDDNNITLFSGPGSYWSDFNRILKNGIFFTTATANRPVSDKAQWFVFVARRQAYATQLAFDPTTGKAYVRSTTNLTTWNSWLSLNNIDVSQDFSNILAAIGDRIYTAPTYVTNGQSLTQSIDALDIALNATNGDLSGVIADLNTINGIIGSRLYTEQVTVTNEELITTSIDQLDMRRTTIHNTEDLNDFRYSKAGTYTISPFNEESAGTGHPAHTPNYASKIGSLILTTSSRQVTFSSAVFIEQSIFNVLTGSIWRRVYNTGAWGAWSCIKPATLWREIGDWNIPVGNRQFNHGLPAGKIIDVKASVVNDAGTSWLDLVGIDQASSQQCGGIEWNDTVVILKARLSGPLTTTSYDSTSYNRGYVYIHYLDATPT